MQRSENMLLIVEDDEPLSERLGEGLTEAGYIVQRSSSVQRSVHLIKETPPNLLILDLGLPDSDGMELLCMLQEEYPSIPVIITTARDSIPDRVRGLESGAADYLVKPYAFEELLARIHAQLRHFTRVQLERRVGNLVINIETRLARRSDRILDLTPREFDLLVYLSSLQGNPASREMLQREVWKVKSRLTSIDNVIDVHISRLRQKLEEGETTPLLHTIRGVGFVLKERK